MIELRELGLQVPDGCVVGVTGTGLPAFPVEVRRLGPGEIFGSEERALILDHTFSRATPFEKALALKRLRDICRAGGSLLLLSNDEDLLGAACDELWWFRDGQLVLRGDPPEILRHYRQSVAEELRAFGEGKEAPISPSMRKGDGRAEIRGIDLLGEGGKPSIVWRSGEDVRVDVRVVYRAAAPDPVIGILIRTRVGLNVYGTNTELEQVPVGPVNGGDERTASFAFRCDLCPGDYTLTAASHDPDGLWHEWLEDAVAFTVTDSRFTAGVANLRAKVQIR